MPPSPHKHLPPPPLHVRYRDDRTLVERVLDPAQPVAELGGRIPPPRATAEWFDTRDRGA